MTGIAEHFALLAAGAPPRHESQMLTRAIGLDVPLGDVLVGLDHVGRRHLLVPVGDETFAHDHASQGVVLDERLLTTAVGAARFADLACLAPTLAGPFEQLVVDVANRLRVSGLRPVTTIVQTLEDWRALLRGALRGLSRETVLGLVGELEVLSRLAVNQPVEAVSGWQGPTGATHDFSRNGSNIEVKATASVSATSVRISNLDQLDASLVRELHLAVLHLHESADAPDIEARIDGLVRSGVPAGRLLSALETAGYVRGMDVGIPTRYAVRDVWVWRLGADFPVLRQSEVAPRVLQCVANVEYDLVLGALPECLSGSEVDALFAQWGGTE